MDPDSASPARELNQLGRVSFRETFANICLDLSFRCDMMAVRFRLFGATGAKCIDALASANMLTDHRRRAGGTLK